MGKRELRALEREQAERSAARSAVYAALQADPVYVRLRERMERANRRVTEAPTPAEQDRRLALFRRAHKRMTDHEDAALRAAGFVA